jgi:hypothetical protein
LALLTAGSIALVACGSSGDPSPSAARDTSAAPSTTVAPATTAVRATTTVATTAVANSAWTDQAAQICDAFAAGLGPIPQPDGSAASIVDFVGAVQKMSASVPRLEDIDVPADRRADFGEIVTIAVAGQQSLTAAGAAAGRGDLAAAEAALTRTVDSWASVSGRLAAAGARCGDAEPARAEAAALNVPVELAPNQLGAGFGSVWVSQAEGTAVVRLDGSTGEVLAKIDVGDSPFKSQPADGRMWVRTGSSYVAVDPATNAVVTRLAKTDVGPKADRSWAVDGAMWICDGQQLHRYDPTTVQPVALVELGIDCGQVFATDELVVAWTYNEDESESGTSAAAFVDPATNAVVATVPLPVDVGVPAVLDDAVFFGGHGGPTAVVIDRATWSVAATPELGRPTGGSLVVTDGERIFVPTYYASGPKDVLVVDAGTFAVKDTIEPLGNNAVALLDGALWTADGQFNMVQRHDV